MYVYEILSVYENTLGMVFSLSNLFLKKRRPNFFRLFYFYNCPNEVNLLVVDPTCHFLHTFHEVE